MDTDLTMKLLGLTAFVLYIRGKKGRSCISPHPSCPSPPLAPPLKSVRCYSALHNKWYPSPLCHRSHSKPERFHVDASDIVTASLFLPWIPVKFIRQGFCQSHLNRNAANYDISALLVGLKKSSNNVRYKYKRFYYIRWHTNKLQKVLVTIKYTPFLTKCMK